MDKSLIIQATAQWVEHHMKDEPTGHDWFHVQRVRQCALYIQSREGGDRFIIEMAALLHDMGDHKLHNGRDKSKETALHWMNQFVQITPAEKEHIASICESISFKGAGVDTTVPTLEGKIVQDADRLDALGAIGIARAFAWGGKKHRMIYHPDIKPVLHTDFESYKRGGQTTINHFYEKLLLLYDRMQTQTGKNLAKEKHKVVENFLQQFFHEWKACEKI